MATIVLSAGPTANQGSQAKGGSLHQTRKRQNGSRPSSLRCGHTIHVLLLVGPSTHFPPNMSLQFSLSKPSHRPFFIKKECLPWVPLYQSTLHFKIQLNSFSFSKHSRTKRTGHEPSYPRLHGEVTVHSQYFIHSVEHTWAPTVSLTQG